MQLHGPVSSNGWLQYDCLALEILEGKKQNSLRSTAILHGMAISECVELHAEAS